MFFITLQIYKEYPIYHDARFVIEANGFLGDQYVAVVPTANQNPTLTNGQEVECESPFNLQEVARGAAGLVTRLDDTAKKLDSSVSDLRAQVLNSKTLANFGEVVTNLRVITDQAVGTMNTVNGIISTNRAGVGDAVSNLVFFSTELAQLGNTASNLLATNGANLTAATKNIQDLTVNAQQIVTDIQAGKGLAGALLQNQQEVYHQCRPACWRIWAIASSNSNRYGLWHFLWAHPRGKHQCLWHGQIHPSTMKQLWPIRILFLGLCVVAGFAVSQAPESREKSRTAPSSA